MALDFFYLERHLLGLFPGTYGCIIEIATVFLSVRINFATGLPHVAMANKAIVYSPRMYPFLKLKLIPQFDEPFPILLSALPPA